MDVATLRAMPKVNRPQITNKNSNGMGGVLFPLFHREMVSGHAIVRCDLRVNAVQDQILSGQLVAVVRCQMQRCLAQGVARVRVHSMVQCALQHWEFAFFRRTEELSIQFLDVWWCASVAAPAFPVLNPWRSLHSVPARDDSSMQRPRPISAGLCPPQRLPSPSLESCEEEEGLEILHLSLPSLLRLRGRLALTMETARESI